MDSTSSTPALGSDTFRLVDRRSPVPDFHFSVVIPPTWRAVAIATVVPESGDLKSIGLVRNQGGIEVEAEILVMPLQYEVDGASIHESLVRSAGQSILDCSALDRKDCESSVITSIETGEGDVVVHKSATLRFGRYLFVVDCRVRSSRFPEVLKEFDRILETFVPLHPNAERYAEKLEVVKLPAPFVGQVSWFASWTLAHQESNERHRVSLVFSRMIRGSLMGSISITGLCGAELPEDRQLLEKTGTELRRKGFDIDPFTEPSPLVKNSVRRSRVRTAGRLGEAEMEVEVNIVRNEAQVLVFTLVGPSTAENNAVRAMNFRALAVMADLHFESMQRPLRSVEADQRLRQDSE